MAESDRPRRLSPLHDFGSNPGELDAYVYAPSRLGDRNPLVVVLHGSTQDAESYDRGAGWSALADEYGFALLYPEQRRGNNGNLGFNWYELADTMRGQGEPLSIRQMISQVTAHLNIDPERIFITGLSSGGAMACVLMATYPEVFAGGAVIGGLPFRTADGAFQALLRMKGFGGPSDLQLGALVRAATPHSAGWPTISVWHGDRDTTVVPSNADAIVRQWQVLHGVDALPTLTEKVDGHERRVWCCPAGREVIEAYRIVGMGHGTPLATAGSNACGLRGNYMLEAGISSTRQIARFWNIGPAAIALRSELVAAA